MAAFMIKSSKIEVLVKLELPRTWLKNILAVSHCFMLSTVDGHGVIRRRL